MRRLLPLLLSILLLGCSQPDPAPVAVVNDPTPALTATSTPSPTATTTAPPTPTATHTASPTAAPPTATPTTAPTLPPSPTPTITPLPTATVDPYIDLGIDALTARSYGGGELEILETLDTFDTFKRYLIRYPSDGLNIYGFMNVPNEGWDFPVALVLHGHVEREKWRTVTYTRRYADALAEAGYMVIHPNYRNHAPSDSGDNPFRIGYAIDILNLLAIVETQSQDIMGPLRRADESRIDIMGHSMGGGIAQRVAVVRPDVIDSVMLYASMNGNERINIEKILEWQGRYDDVEALVSAETLALISPHEYFDRLTAPIAIHHSTGDDIVPVEWSDDLCVELRQRNHPVDCHKYYNFPHTFYGDADDLLIERMIRFFNEN